MLHTSLKYLSVGACALGCCLHTSALSAQPADGDVTEVVETVVPAESADTTEDVTETVGGEPAESMASPAAEPAAPPSNVATFGGWLRQSLERTPNSGGYGIVTNDPWSVPRDRWFGSTQLLLRAGLRHGEHLEAALSGLLTLTARDRSGRGAELEIQPDLREAYLALSWPAFELRLGQQRVAWGRTDALSPNDVINARDLRDPFLGEPELRSVPTPLARASVYAGDWTLELLASPVLVPDRFSLYGTNTAAVSLDTPAAYRGFFGLLTSRFQGTSRAALLDVLASSNVPEPGLDALSGGATISTSAAGIDLALHYHYGFDGTPALNWDPSFVFLLNETDFSQASLANLSPVLRAVDAGLQPFEAEYVRRHHAGLDAAMPIGSFVLRLDAAFQSERVFYATDLTSHVSPTALVVAAVEYQTGAIDEVILVEAVYIAMLKRSPVPLLAYDRESYGASMVVRWPLFGRLSLDLRAIVGVKPRMYIVQPALQLAVDGFTLKVGGLLPGGERFSAGWYNRRNTTLYAQARYAF